MQKILVMSTDDPSMRSNVWDWVCEDPSHYKPAQSIDDTPLGSCPPYQNVLSALFDGWKLLAPPQLIPCDTNREHNYVYEWWFTKEY